MCDTEIYTVNISYLVVSKPNVPGEQNSKPITSQLYLDALSQFLQ